MGSKICIYCRGTYGVLTYLTLKKCGIKVDFFGDRDPAKQGYVIDEVNCISYEEVLAQEKDILIIVAITNPDSLIDLFLENGFTNVISYKEYLNNLVESNILRRKKITDMKVLEEMKGALYEGIYKNEICLRKDEISDIITEFRVRKQTYEHRRN